MRGGAGKHGELDKVELRRGPLGKEYCPGIHKLFILSLSSKRKET